jgi:hypothetical protein
LRLSPIRAQSATTKATTKYPRQSNLKIPMIMLAPSLLTDLSARDSSPHAFVIGRPSETKLQFFCCEMSRRDGAIVAWHEVPGKGPFRKGRPVGYGVTVFRYFAGSGKIHERRTTSGTSCVLRPIIPYPTGRCFGGLEGRCPRHFVPGYGRVVPPGQNVLFSGIRIT